LLDLINKERHVVFLFILLDGILRKQGFPKHLYISIRLHGKAPEKTVFFTFTAATASNIAFTTLLEKFCFVKVAPETKVEVQEINNRFFS